MKKFKCTVTRTDKYIIEFDENVINEEFMKDYRKSFYNLKTLEEHAKNLAELRARYGDGFSEGYGHVRIDGKIPWFAVGIDVERLPSEDAINIKIISEDNNCEVDVKEI